MNRKHLIALVKSFIAENDLDMQHAALLLGGPPALARLQRFRRLLSAAPQKVQRVNHELKWLHSLFSLENVGDIDSEESGYFAMIDPDDRAVGTICVLVENIEELLNNFDVVADTDDDAQSEVAA